METESLPLKMKKINLDAFALLKYYLYPMFQTVKYPYSLKFSLGTLSLMVLLMLILLRNVIGFNTAFIWVIYGFCVVMFISLSIIIFVKRLIPAIKGEPALQLDEEGISDYVRDVSISWKDIKEIKLISGVSAATMHINLKWESEFGSQIDIQLRWIKGRDKEIYETTMNYFKGAFTEK